MACTRKATRRSSGDGGTCLLLVALALLLLPAGRAEGGDMTKRLVQKLPKAAMLSAVAVNGKIYAFEFVEDDRSAEDVAAAGGVFIHDPASGTWKAGAKMPAPRSSCSLVTAVGRIFVIGGFTAPGVPSNTVQEYDIAADSWKTRRPMPTPRGRMGTIVVDGRIYALGGKVGEEVFTDAVEAYDPATDAWAVRRKLSTPLMGISVAAVNGKIYKLKGTTVRGGRWLYVFDFEEYDPTADTWTKKAAWTFDREPLDFAAVGNRLFVVGAGAFTAPSTRSLREYDIAGDRWLTRADMPAAAAHTIHPSAVVAGGRVCTFGGGFREGNAWKASDRAQCYDPGADRWEELPRLEEGKIGMPAVAAGDSIYVLGGERMGPSGQTGKNLSSLVEVYEMKTLLGGRFAF